MKPLTAREVERYLRAAGYMHSRTEGSHHVWTNSVSRYGVLCSRGNNWELRVEELGVEEF